MLSLIPSIEILMLALVVLLLGGLSLSFFHYRKVRAQLHQLGLENEYQRHTIQVLIQNQEAERDRLARTLHDEIGGSLSTAKLQMQRLKKRLSTQPDVVIFEKDISNLIHGILSRIRFLSEELRPPLLERFGLSVSLKDLFEQMKSHTGVEIDLYVQGEEKRLKWVTELSVYRVFQSLLLEAQPLSAERQIMICLSYLEKEICVFWQDNQEGGDGPNSQISWQLENWQRIKSRIENMGGSLVHDSNSLGNNLIELRIPLQNQAKHTYKTSIPNS
ncbi:MAG: sensor histidine kinase [Bacteroidia bacterium]